MASSSSSEKYSLDAGEKTLDIVNFLESKTVAVDAPIRRPAYAHKHVVDNDTRPSRDDYKLSPAGFNASFIA